MGNNEDLPFRPVALRNTSVNLSECHVASLEHCPNVFRLYSIGKKAKGVFRNENIVCESISKNEEANNCIGLLIFNKTGYDCALKDFHNYWEWRKNRNESRWKMQENGMIDYDAKNMMHMYRLLLSGENILLEGFPIVRFSGEKLQILRDILIGKFQYDEIIELANTKIEYLIRLNQQSKLPEQPDLTKINDLLFSITSSWENSYE